VVVSEVVPADADYKSLWKKRRQPKGAG